jgi:Ca-activated chloride channel family protein
MDLAHPHFAEPAWLWLAFLGPAALLVLQSYSARAREKQLARLAAPNFIAELTRSHSPWRRNIKNVMLVLSIAGIGLALARPQWGQREETGQTFGDDVLFVLDCSQSMLATDVSPSRLQRAKLAILDFVQSHAHGRAGLVAFAGEAFLQCPLTFDYAAFEDALKAVDERTIPVMGTDIGRGLDEAEHALAKTEGRKIIVVVTDGEDLEKQGIAIAKKLAQKGITIFTIGVGTPAGAEIQVINEQGRPEMLRDRKGEVVHSRLGEDTLQEIAKAAHGSYYPLGPLGEGLAKVRLALETMQTQAGSVPTRKLGVDRFHVVIAVVLGLVVTESLLGTRRRGRDIFG